MEGNGIQEMLSEDSLSTKNGGVTSPIESFSVDVEIVGTCAAIMHRYDCEEVEVKANAKKGSKEKKTDNVESYVYRDENGFIGWPFENIKACICEAAKRYPDPSSPRRSARDLFRAAIIITPEVAPILNAEGKKVKTWDTLDVRPAVIQMNRVTRRRPMFHKGWKLNFTVEVIDPEYIDQDLLHTVIERAGKHIGLSDFRPDFGRFRITSFKPVKMKS